MLEINCIKTKTKVFINSKFTISAYVYQSYSLVKPFKGDNYQDMMNKIDSYLKNLIDFINEPVVECSHCKGIGINLDPNWGVK